MKDAAPACGKNRVRLPGKITETFFLPDIAGRGREKEGRFAMTRTLPPRPDFTQLKHQAKDLLRAHERMDSSACTVLRRLRQFAAADDAAILARPLALHQAQYALAKEYGFASWNALKRHVEKVTNRPSPLRRENGRTYVAGLEKLPLTCQNSVISCIAGAMEAMGEAEMTYEYLMWACGGAFRVQMRTPTWCPSAACAAVGYNLVPGAMKVTGYRLTHLPTGPDMPTGHKLDGPELAQAIERARPAVTASIERGVPALFDSEECGLIVGYKEDGQRIVRPYKDGEGYVDTDKWPWGVGIIEPEDMPMDRHAAVVNSLHLAVTLAKTERFGNYLSGFAALESWADGLLDEARFAALTDANWFPIAHGNGYCYGCYYTDRGTAEKYLRDVADDYQDPIRSELLATAGVYGKIHELLGCPRPEVNCAWSLQPWVIGALAKWTPAMRQAESQTLRECLALERQAIGQIEHVLTQMEVPADVQV
jgi:hypothetical protein